jgi:predicted nucleotidyltransferase
MRKSGAIDALLPRTRKLILATMMMDPSRWWYQSDLAHRLGLRSSSLQRELASLVAAGILRRERDGNRVYFQADPTCPFLPELTGLLRKTAGLVDVLREALRPWASSIRLAFVYGSLARSEERSASDVDLMIIGSVGLSKLLPALRKAERLLNRPINPSVYTPEELATKLQRGHHFLEGVLRGERLFVLGSDDELAATFGKPARPKARNHSPRAR